MRLRQCITPIVGLLLLATTHNSSWSQTPSAMPNSASVAAPGYARPANYGYQQPLVAPPMVAPANGYPVNASQFMAPPTFNPWPAVSPYEYDFSSHSIENGLWMRETVNQNSGRRYMGGVEYLFNRTKKLSGIFGDKRAFSYKDTVLPILREDPFDLDDLADAFEGISPQQQQGGNNNNNNQAQVEIGPGNNLYDTVHFTEFGDLKAPGTRLNFGWLNADDSGIMMSFMWSSDVSQRLNIDPGLGRGNQSASLLALLEIPENINDPTTIIPRDLSGLIDPLGPTIDVDQILQNNLLNLRGIPFDDGTVTELADGTVFGGAAAPYDLEFNLTIESETFGTSLMSYLNPVYKTSLIKIRPIVGIRYMHIREGLKFRGVDSGLTYDDQDSDDPIFPDVKLHSLPNGFDDNGDGIVDNAGLVEDMFQGGGGGGGQNNMFRFIQFRSPFESPIVSTFRSESRTHLVGPEVGMQYEMGGDNFKVLGHTTVAMLGNFERLTLRGNNFGVITRDNNFTPNSPDNPDPNAFSDRQTHSHVSPLIEQSIAIEGPIFRYLPVLQRVRVLRTAVFRFGYTYTLINEVVRGPNSVRYTSNPAQGLFPTVSAKRGNWYVRNFNMGVHWSF